MKIGFTTSFPLEPLVAAGHELIDLNNIFITGNSQASIRKAERDGYPRNICSWIKGIYGEVAGSDFDMVMGIVQGDCSNTHSLLKTLEDTGIRVDHFSFPYDRDRSKLADEIMRLEHYYGVSRAETMKVKQRYDKIRKKLIELDELNWRDGRVNGRESHEWLVSASDFWGDAQRFESELDEFLITAKLRSGADDNALRLGFAGVPPIFTDLYDFLEAEGAMVVFNEIQRQFAMPSLHDDIVDQYLDYTYPYSVSERIIDLKRESSRRSLDGLISYTQSFCHRQIDNILIKKYLEIPVLTLEGDAPGELDARSRLRIESFLDMLRYSKK